MHILRLLLMLAWQWDQAMKWISILRVYRLLDESYLSYSRAVCGLGIVRAELSSMLNYAIQERQCDESSFSHGILEEGFPTVNEALRFFDAEVGIEARIVRVVEKTGQLLPQTDWLKPELTGTKFDRPLNH